MHAFLIHNSQFSISNSPDTLMITPEKSIGIEEVRQIRVFLSRKPIQTNNTVVIYEAHLLTVPAQNALLKTLEEPPGLAQVYLVTNYPDQLLPTVLSRVQISPHTASLPNLPNSTKSQDLLNKLLKSKIEDRLRILDETAFTRETALEFLSDIEIILHRNLDLKLDYDLILQTRRYLKANCSVRLSMDNFVILSSLHGNKAE